MTCRVILFVDHEIGYRLLEKIANSHGLHRFEIAAVVTTQENGDMWWPGVSTLCQKHNIPLHRYCESFSDSLQYTNIDWYLLLSWKHIIKSPLLTHPNSGIINLHYSLLPDYRGVYPVNWAIINGEKKTGVTYHLVNANIDDGRIICQRETPIALMDTARSLQLRLDEVAFGLFDELSQWIFHYNPHSNKFLEKAQSNTCYKSRIDFISSNKINLDLEYKAIDLINLLRGKSFIPSSKNLYMIDPTTGKRIYIQIKLELDEEE